MKNNKLAKLVAIVLLITVLTLIIIASTYAKYTSSFTGTGSATTADWKVSLKGDGAIYSQTFTLTAAQKIYPGSSGKLGTVTLENSSELVKAKIVNVTISDIKVDGTANPITNLTISDPDVSGQTSVAPNGTATFDVNYNWTYSQTDETAYANKPITFTVTVTVDQVAD